MDEIPEDIINSARKVVGKPNAAMSPQGTDKMVLIVAKALFSERLAENERCANIAEDWEGPEKLLPMCSDEYNEVAAVGMHEASERISEAIRRR